MPFFSTKDGPIVIEIPAAEGGSITGTIMDAWQAALEDVGPAGVEQGKGGKYLITPPGYTGAVPDGHIVLPSSTYGGYGLLRSIVRTRGDADVAAAAAYGRRIRLYSLARAADPSPTVFHDASGAVFDSTNTYDLRFFEALDRVVQAEPWLERDKAMIDALATIGIEKGKAFDPDARDPRYPRTSRDGSARLAQCAVRKRLRALLRGRALGPSRAKADLMKTAPTFYEAADAYSVDSRGLTDFWAFSTVKHLGAGQFYLLALRDGDGDLLDGGKTYRPRRSRQRADQAVLVGDGL
ncbi:MAG: DUF1254 domain-containing protein [Rhizomicrobium sp.]